MTRTQAGAAPGWLRPAALGGGVLLILLTMTYYGGTARPGPLFALGVGVLAGTLLLFGLGVWWLLLSPLGASAADRPALSAEARQSLAVLVALSGLLFITGGLWDEVWHRLYGIGTAISDFWWRPHLMIYGSMGLMALFALGGLMVAVRGGGGLRQRFRAEPRLGLLALTAAYLVLAAPSDELWHRIYGLDITAWSLPHILFGVGVTLVMLAGSALQVSVLPRPAGWRGLGGLRPGEGLLLILLAVSLIAVMQIALTEWEVLRAAPSVDVEADQFLRAFWRRPEWMYPAALITIAAFYGQVAVHSLRRAGAATLLTAAVLGFRVVVLGLFAVTEAPTPLTLASQVLVLAPAVALDLWYAARLRQAETALTRVGGSLAGAAAFLLVSVPLLPQFLSYPRVNAVTLPGIVGMSLVLAVWGGWLGRAVGDWLQAQARPAGVQGAVPARVVWVGAGVLAAFAAFTFYFIATATPPV